MKKLILVILLVAFFYGVKYIYDVSNNLPKPKTAAENSIMKRLDNHVNEVRKLAAKNPRYNNEIGFFIDMKIPSGKNRFFIYDLRESKVIYQGLVAHGSGCETGIEGKLKFSNLDNSYCSSLGKYYVDISYYGQFGKAYKLYGLDKTNSNAYSRNIVLHKYSKVPFDEQEEPICNSLGCPMVNEKYFKLIENILDNSEKNIILDIYF